MASGSQNSAETSGSTTGTDYEGLASYLAVSTMTLLIYDYLLTLDLECRFVWSNLIRWSNGLYLLQRYLPFLDMMLLLIATFAPSLHQKYCYNVLKSSLWLHTAGISLSEVMLSLRVWAISRQRSQKYFSIILSTCLVTMLAGGPIIMGIFSKTHYVAVPILGLKHGCLHTDNPIGYAIAFGILVVYECGCFLLIIDPAISQFKNRKLMRLYNPVYRDAVLQYVLLVAIASINIALVSGVSVDLSFICMPLFRVFHSITTSRIVLHIRQAMNDSPVLFISQSDVTGSIVFAAHSTEIETS